MAETEGEGEDIFSIFSKEEKEGLPEKFQKKIGDVWCAKVKEITCLKVEKDKIKINADQEKFHLEREIVTLTGQLEEERALREEASQSKESNESRIIKLEDELCEAKTKVISLTRELQQSQNEQEDVSSQSAAMAGSLETRTRRIQELQEQVNILEEQLTQSSRSKYDAILKAEDCSSKELKAQYKEKRLEQEIKLLSRQVEVLQQQIRERSEENLDQKREHSSTILNLQASLNLNMEELRVVKEEKELLQKQCEDKSKRIEELLTALNTAREAETKLDEMYRQELSAQKKLALIYQGSAEDERERCGELDKALEEQRQLLQSASEQYGLLERTKENAEEEHAAALKQSTVLINELKDELSKANVLLNANAKKDTTGLEELSPAASAASNLINRGLSLTQLYSEYMTVSEKLHASEEEKKKLQRYVDGILEEIEARVPVFKKHREDHQRALETINSLHSQLENCLSQMEKQKLDLDEAVRRRNYLERENDRLNQQAKDLSKQVTILVTQVEAARAGQPPPPIPKDSSGVKSGGDVISDRLVAFRNVSELQEQNKMLRETLRKISEEMDTTETNAISSRTKEMEEELKSVKAQLSEIQSLRERQESLMDNISKQRDMYKSFCNDRSPKTQKTPPVKQPPQMFGVPQEDVQRMQKELDEARNKMDVVNKEHEEYRVEVRKNEKMQLDEYNRLRTTMEKAMSENVKLLSQAEFNDERLKVLQHNSEVLQRQLGALQNNNSTLQGIIGRHESTIEAQRREFMGLQKDFSRCQVANDNMREELKLLKEAETRLLAERESVSRSQSSQAIVLANLESIKNNLERTDSEKTMRLENKVSELMEKCSRLQAKLEANTDYKEAQSKLSIAEGQLKSLQNENKNLTKQLMDSKAELMTTKSRLKDTQERVRAPITSPTLRSRSPLLGTSPGQPGTSPFRMGGPQVRDLQVQLTEEKAKVTALQSSLEQSKKNISELMNVTKQQEKQLKDSSESYRITQEQFKKMQKERNEMEATLTKIQGKLTATTSDGENVKSRLQTMLDEAKDELQASEKRLKDSNECFQKAKEEEERARKEAHKLNDLTAEVQNKYEREVMLHGTDLKTLAELKKRQSDFDSELQKVTVAKTKAEEAVRDTRLGFEKRENVLRRENKDLMVRAHELEEQNKSLLDNFTTLSDKMAAIQAKLSSGPASGEGGNMSFSEDEARSSDQLREVIKYLRRERDVAAGKIELAEAETQRYAAQKKLLEAQIKEITKNLSQEREKSKASLDSASNYGHLLRKVHTIDALADSNRLLRDEKEHLEGLYEEHKAKCEALEKQIEPMNERHKTSLNKIEALVLEKKSMESEKDLYKKRTQELVEKLNHAKPEDFMKLQQNFAEQQKSLQAKENDLSKLKLQLQQVQKNLQMTIAQKNQFNSQLQSSREEARKLGEESRKTTMEKARIQQQIVEENKKYTMERTRLQQQLAQTQERVRTLEATAQQSEATHQQEMRKIQDQFSQDKQQIQDNREQVLESKGREDQIRHQLEIAKKEKDEMESQLEDAKMKIVEINAKAENYEKQTLQLRKIATKYKRQAESSMSASPGAPDMGEEGMPPSAEKVKEMEENIQSLRQKQESTKEECLKFQEEITTLKETVSTKESEMQNMKSQIQQKEAEMSKFRNELEAKKRELQASTLLSSQLHQGVNKQISDLTKRLEESQSKKQVSESRLMQYEKERDQNVKEIEMLNKKLQMQQRQIENLQKQAAGTSKPSTSGVSSEKSVFEPPPTANIKPMNAPVTPSASPRSQAATQVVPPSRPIPTASIRPMAPPSGSSAPPQGSTVVVVSPLETHSDGMVSSTVTLPQATVTPTPAISASTLLTTTTTTPASTLTATVSPTPASAAITTPVATAAPLTSITTPQSITATQSTSVSQSSAAALEASQSSAATQPGSSVKTTVAPSSSLAVQSTVTSKCATGQPPASASTFVVSPLVPATTGGPPALTKTPSKSPGAPTLSREQDNQDISADALVSQAIALVTPLSSQEAAGPSGVNLRKRKLDSTPELSDEMKRRCTEDEGALSSEEAGPSSSHAGREKGEEARHTAESDDVILLDSDEDDGHEDYPDQGEEGEDDDDDDDDDDHMDDHDRRGAPVRVTDSDDDMEHDDSSREASQGFEAGQETREAEGDLGNAEAEAEASSEASAGTRRDHVETQERQSERPQPSAGPSQPSSSSQSSETPSQTGSRPVALPRPIVRQDRLGGVGRQNLTPFSQLPQYEEGGDDSIVPSTPTLFVPRRDGFSEAVSSPQVPSSGFVFGSNPDITNTTQRSGLAQMAEGGLIDDTRIDLGQLDEVNRSQPTTPLHRSPTGTEGGVSTSEGGALQREPPTVVITGAEQSNDEASQGSQDHFTEADSMAIAVDDGDEDDDEDDDDVDEEEEEGEEEEEEDDEDQGDDDGDMEEHGDDHSHSGDLEERGSSDDNSQPSQDVSSVPSGTPSSPQRRITPITWNDHQQRGRGARGMGRGGSIMGGRSRPTRGLINRERGVSPLHGGRARRSRPTRPSGFYRGGPH